MADFHQVGPITTLPRLVGDRQEKAEAQLRSFSRRAPLALLIPCLVKELQQPALARMVEMLAGTPYLDSVFIALDRADAQGYQRALRFFRALGLRTWVLWLDADPFVEIIREMEGTVGSLGPRGKGRAVWLGLGAINAQGRAGAVAFLDADIVTFQRSLLTNLVFPVLHPGLDYDYAKAYYARFDDRLYGRVTRLLVRPLLQALSATIGQHPYLAYLEAFRYPLAGEFALNASLLRRIRIPADWGLEVGLLFEVLRHRSPRRICQVDVTDRFDHKHQSLSANDPGKGLHRMAVDITKHLLRTLAAGGVVVPSSSHQALLVAFQRYGEDAVLDSWAVAEFNGLVYDRHAEEEAVEVFRQALGEGCEQFLRDPLGTPPLPNWARVFSALPEVGERLLSVVRDLDGELAP